MSQVNHTRSSTVAHRGSNPGPREFRVRFTRPLRGARLTSGTEEHAPLVVSTPVPATTQHTPAVVASPPQPPIDFWVTDAGREQQADRDRIETVLGSVQAAVENLRTAQAEQVRELRQVAVELALTIATRVLHQRVEAEDFPIEAKVRDMIEQLGADEPVTVRLNPADLTLLNERLGGEPLTADRADPRFVADANLGRGDCHVDGRESMLVSDVARELQEIRDELLRSLKNARS